MKPKVFIGSSTENLTAAEAIQRNLCHDAEVAVWNQGIFQISGGFLEDILNAVSDSDFGIFVFGPDDSITIRAQEYTATRDNVVFEYGLFLGRIGRSRSFFVVPTDAENLWVPTDLAGINRAFYQGNAENLDASLGPACSQIKVQMRKLGIRASRFRQRALDGCIVTDGPRLAALNGIWKGTFQQRADRNAKAGSAEMEITMKSTSDGIIGEGRYVFREENNEAVNKVALKVTGNFYFNRFLKLEYANADGAVMQFGSGVLELNAPGNELEGEYSGYGAWSNTVVSGTLRLTK